MRYVIGKPAALQLLKCALILVEMLILATVVDCIRAFLTGWEAMWITEK